MATTSAAAQQGVSLQNNGKECVLTAAPDLTVNF